MDFDWFQWLWPLQLQSPWLLALWTCSWVLASASVVAWAIQRRQARWQEQITSELENAIQTRTLELQATLIELNEKNKALEEQNTRDALTGVRNRAYFDKKILAELKRSRREQRPLALIMLDIDHFKRINDQYGHLAGDAVIRTVAQRIRAHLRRSSDQICRYGGEEFALILPNTDLAGALQVAEQVRQLIAMQPCTTEVAELPVTISLGVHAQVADASTSTHALIEHADKALYQAKTAGRNRVCPEAVVTPAPVTDPVQPSADDDVCPADLTAFMSAAVEPKGTPDES